MFLLVKEARTVDIRHFITLININIIKNIRMMSITLLMVAEAMMTTRPPAEHLTVLGQQEWLSRATVGLIARPTS